MQTIRLQVEDSDLDSFLTIIKNLKHGLVKNLEIDSEDKYFLETKSYFKECLHELESGKSELLNEEEYKAKISSFTDELKSKYANH